MKSESAKTKNKFIMNDVVWEEEIESGILNTDHFQLKALKEKHDLIVAQREALLLLAVEMVAELSRSKNHHNERRGKAWGKRLILIADGKDLFQEELALMLDSYS